MKNKKQKAEGGKAESGKKIPDIAGGTPALPGGDGAHGVTRPTVSSGEFKMVPRGFIRPDPGQPRKDFSEEQLKEMAVSIYLQGIIQPLVVKYVPPQLVIHEPDLHLKSWRATDPAGAVVFEGSEEDVRRFAEGKTNEFYQLIAGERRWRSTVPQTLEIDGQEIEWPGLKELPVMVRVADERAVFALQHIENQKRVNLSALEEAQAFGRELESRRQAAPTFTAEKLGEELGIKRGTVFNLMKLLRLKEPVRRALLAGKIETSHARAIASVPDVKRQEELLERVAEEADYGEAMMSVRALEEMIDEAYVKQLKDAPFDQEDAALLPSRWAVAAGDNEISVDCPKQPSIPHLSTIGLPKVLGSSSTKEYGLFYVTDANNFDMAGPMIRRSAKDLADMLVKNVKAGKAEVTQTAGWACTVCPHRSGVMDPTTKTPKVCTLPACFDAKVKAHWVKKSEELKAKGTPVLTEGEMRKKGKHVPEDKHEYTQNRSGVWKDLMGKHAPEPVLVATKEGIKKFYPAEDAVAAAKKNGVKFYNQSKPLTTEDVAKEKARTKRQEELKSARQSLVRELTDLLVPQLNAMKDTDAWVLLLKGRRTPYDQQHKKLIEQAKGARAKVLAHLLGEDFVRSVVDWQTGAWEKDTLTLWSTFGVDLVAEEKKRDEAAQPKLPLAKPEAQQKTLIDVKQKGKKTKKK